jgi:response regulator RpfG family c-di-GMP phosphodiesterase
MLNAHILVVDDEPLVGESIERVLRAYGYTTTVVHSGDEALQVLAQGGVSLCLTDLHMPGINGRIIASYVRHHYPNIPVVIMTGDHSLEALRDVLDNGASDFILKPWRSHELPIVIERNLRRQRIWLDEQQRHLRQMNEAYSDMLEALLIALETREREIEGHCERVTTYTIILAEAMGLSYQQLPDIERGALLHDVGKIGIPDRILFKKGRLTAAEWEVMRQHPVIGYRMCMKVRSLQKAAQEIVLCHHEQWDGSGYPHGLRGEDIPLGARIFAVADALDAMTSDRPYRQALSIAEAVAELERCAGTQFDPKVVKAFLDIPVSVWESIIGTMQTMPTTRSSTQDDSFPLPTVSDKAA